MVLIKVQYDAYNRQFKLLDGQLAHNLEDGETYLLIAEVAVGDLQLSIAAADAMVHPPPPELVSCLHAAPQP